jgi:hypothetical protein
LADREGVEGTPVTVTFTVVPTDTTPDPTPVPDVGTVTSLTLVDSDTDTDVSVLTNGDVLDLSDTTLPANFNIRADVDGIVRSVYFDGQWTGTSTEQITRTESVAPYAWIGDDGGDYDGRALLPGTYTITVTPYSETGSDGVRGEPFSLGFTVIE